jgi:hypothetical protein
MTAGGICLRPQSTWPRSEIFCMTASVIGVDIVFLMLCNAVVVGEYFNGVRQ